MNCDKLFFITTNNSYFHGVQCFRVRFEIIVLLYVLSTIWFHCAIRSKSRRKKIHTENHSPIIRVQIIQINTPKQTRLNHCLKPQIYHAHTNTRNVTCKIHLKHTLDIDNQTTILPIPFRHTNPQFQTT